MAELSMEARMLAEAREKALKDINSIRGEAMREGIKEGIKKGIKEGKREGIKEGKREGIKEGIKKGIKEGKREDAKMMLMEGLDLKLIIKITGLTESEVLELKNELKR